jgi:hypothetical protein
MPSWFIGSCSRHGDSGQPDQPGVYHRSRGLPRFIHYPVSRNRRIPGKRVGTPPFGEGFAAEFGARAGPARGRLAQSGHRSDSRGQPQRHFPWLHLGKRHLVTLVRRIFREYFKSGFCIGWPGHCQFENRSSGEVVTCHFNEKTGPPWRILNETRKADSAHEVRLSF